MDRLVLLSVDDNKLVFDGKSWVSPSAAKWVVLTYHTEVQADVATPYPVQYPQETKIVTWGNYWVCKIKGVRPGSLGLTDVLQVEDPTNGECICGITCDGTEIQSVPVYAVNKETT